MNFVRVFEELQKQHKDILARLELMEDNIKFLFKELNKIKQPKNKKVK